MALQAGSDGGKAARPAQQPSEDTSGDKDLNARFKAAAEAVDEVLSKAAARATSEEEGDEMIKLPQGANPSQIPRRCREAYHEHVTQEIKHAYLCFCSFIVPLCQ